MLLFQHQRKTEQLVALFGVGLIGAATAQALTNSAKFKTHYLKWGWQEADRGNQRHLSEVVENLTANSEISGITVIWCAGQAGFSAASTDMELTNFQAVLDWLEGEYKVSPELRYNFHMVSSAGGLFENQQGINSSSRPLPLRAYGELKLAQEESMLATDWLDEKHIYRPTSVYGCPRPGQRMGLIPTIIMNGTRNRVSTIFGQMDTLRDYVLNEDIGSYISKKVLSKKTKNTTNYYFLGTGRLVSIFEVRNLLEQHLQRKIYWQFCPNSATNTGNITLNQQALPNDWEAVSVEVGIRQVYQYLLSGKHRHELCRGFSYG